MKERPKVQATMKRAALLLSWRTACSRLVASLATLAVASAIALFHVRDIANARSEAQKADVVSVLRDLGLDDERLDGMIEVLNKTDLLDPDALSAATNLATRKTGVLTASAQTGQGTAELLKEIEVRLFPVSRRLELTVPYSDGRAVAWLYDRGKVVERRDSEAGVTLLVELTDREFRQFVKAFPDQALNDDSGAPLDLAAE